MHRIADASSPTVRCLNAHDYQVIGISAADVEQDIAAQLDTSARDGFVHQMMSN